MVKIKINLSLCLITQHAIKTHGAVVEAKLQHYLEVNYLRRPLQGPVAKAVTNLRVP